MVVIGRSKYFWILFLLCSNNMKMASIKITNHRRRRILGPSSNMKRNPWSVRLCKKSCHSSYVVGISSSSLFSESLLPSFFFFFFGDCCGHDMLTNSKQSTKLRWSISNSDVFGALTSTMYSASTRPLSVVQCLGNDSLESIQSLSTGILMINDHHFTTRRSISFHIND